MKRIIIAIVFCGVILSAFSTAYSLPQKPDGKELYERKCSRCHGDDGTLEKKGADNLQESVLSDAALTRIITEGKKKMPAFGSKLSTEQIQAIAVYTKSLRK